MDSGGYPFTSNITTYPGIWVDSSQDWNLIFQTAYAPISTLETDDYNMLNFQYIIKFK